MLLGLPLVYLLRTTLGAMAYLLGAGAWLFYRESWWARSSSPMLFWLLLLLVRPWFGWCYRRARESRDTTALAIAFAIAAAFGLAATANFTRSNLGVLAFAGLFTLVYIAGIEFFRRDADGRLHPLALLGGIAIGGMTIVMTFEEIWRNARGLFLPETTLAWLGFAIEAAFPIAATALALWSIARRSFHFSFLAAAFPVVTGIAWLIALSCGSTEDCAPFPTIFFNLYALALGVELIARGLRAQSMARANFGLLVIAALAVARFFDSDLSFVIRAIGFIVIGLGFLFTNLLLFRRRTTK